MIEKISSHKIVSPKESDLSDINNINTLCFSIPWTFNGLRDDIKNSISEYFLLKDFSNSLIGYIGLWFILDEVQIVNIAIHPKFQSKGYASLLLEHSISVSNEKNSNLITLEVRESNIPAKNLYHKFNFKIVGYRQNYYSSPKEGAILMNHYL